MASERRRIGLHQFCFLFIFFFFSVSGVCALDAVGIAVNQIGKQYEYGSKGPDTFDCSGLVQYSYAQVGVALPPGSQQQALLGTLVSEPYRRGDLLFFEGELRVTGVVRHVGIYEGSGMMINAVSKDFGIKRSDITSQYWSTRFLFARRLINDIVVQQPDSGTLDLAPRGNPVQLLGNGITGTFTNLEIRYDGVNSNRSYYLLILEYQEASYNRFTRREYFSNSVKSTSGAGPKTDVWAAADFGTSIIFDPTKYYAFMLYQLDARPRGVGSDSFPSGCYVQEEPSEQFVTCNPSNISDLYFVLRSAP